MNDIDILVQRATADFQAATLSAELENAKARYLGKGGLVTELLKGMAALEHDEKKSRGAALNVCKSRIETALQLRRDELAAAELQAELHAQPSTSMLKVRSRCACCDPSLYLGVDVAERLQQRLNYTVPQAALGVAVQGFA